MQKGIKGWLGVLTAGVMLCSNAAAVAVSAEEPATGGSRDYKYINIGDTALDPDRVIFVGKAPERGLLSDKVWTESLEEAFTLASPADTILLRSNVLLEKGIEVSSGSYTLDLGGYSITGGNQITPITVSGGELYLAATGGGRVMGGELLPPVAARSRGASALVVNGGRVTVENGTFMGGGQGGHGVEVKNGRLTILKGSFTGGSGTSKTGCGLYAGDLSDGGNISIWNGSFMGGSGIRAGAAVMSGSLDISSFLSSKAASTVTIGGESATYSDLSGKIIEKKLVLTSVSPLPTRETLLPKYERQTLETVIPGSERTVKLAGFIAPQSEFVVGGVSDNVYNGFLKAVDGDKERLVHIFNPTLANESGQAMAYPYVDTLKLAIGMGKEYKNAEFTALTYQNGKAKYLEVQANEEGLVTIPLSKLNPVALALSKNAAVTAAPQETTAAPQETFNDLVAEEPGAVAAELVMGAGVKEEAPLLNPLAVVIAMSMLSLGAFGWSRIFSNKKG